MKIPRGLSGKDLAALLCREWGYRIIHQQGSHIVLETEPSSGDAVRYRGAFQTDKE